MLKILSGFLLILTVFWRASGTKDAGLNSTVVSTYWCDDQPIKDLSHQLELQKGISENIRLQLNVHELKFEQILSNQKISFQELKQFLVDQHNLGCDNPIDVRTNSLQFATTHKEQKATQVTTTKLPTSCADALKNNRPSGAYLLHLPSSDLKPFYVYCLADLNGGAAWTVLQRRQDGAEDFYRGWSEYKRGFGNLYGEYFLGLEKVHALTNDQMHELWLQMEDFENVSRSAKYESFAIDDEDAKYALNVLGKYSGDAGDSLTYHIGQKFTTKDSDNDKKATNCAVEYTGAWWYKACHQSNLNGQYLRGEFSKDKHAKGVNWYAWRGHDYSLKYVHMAIRPVK